VLNGVINVSVGIITIFYIYILWLEMFVNTTRGLKVFKKFLKVVFAPTKALAGNDGKKIIAFHCSLLFS